MTLPLSLVFDLDGTLVDTAPDLAGAMNAVLIANDRPPVPPAEVRHMVGRGARALIERGFEVTGGPVNAADLDRHFDAFIDYYSTHIADASVSFAGVRGVLTRLKAAGHKLGVCTNKPEDLAVALLEALDLKQFFGAVLGADTLDVRKPDPRHLTETVKRIGGDLTRAVMIGDSEVDNETARNAGVPAVIFTFGYTQFDPTTFGAAALLDSYDDLEAALAGIAENLDTAG
jgi:phosphoglycolate phosphatase